MSGRGRIPCGHTPDGRIGSRFGEEGGSDADRSEPGEAPGPIRRAAAARAPREAAARSGATTRPARIVDLYRTLARQIHPDSPSALRHLEPGRLGALWADVQGAYEAGSLERLLAIWAWVEMLADADASGDAPPSRSAAIEQSFSERFGRLRVLHRSRRALQRQLTELRADPAWDFAEQGTRARRKLARHARTAIDDEIARLRRALQELDEFFDSIGPARPPRPRHRR